jgi:DNA (cytosine-5)-methyltransferase 1
VAYRGKPAADAPRYRVIGNAMAVPCLAWLERRLLQALA